MFDDKQFDKQFNSTFKLAKRGAIVMFGIWIVGALISLAVTGGLIYVAVHFISKYW